MFWMRLDGFGPYWASMGAGVAGNAFPDLSFPGVLVTYFGGPGGNQDGSGGHGGSDGHRDRGFPSDIYENIVNFEAVPKSITVSQKVNSCAREESTCLKNVFFVYRKNQ